MILNRVIDSENVRISGSGVSLIHRLPVPADIESIQDFLKRTNFCHQFVGSFSGVTQPLDSLLRGSIPFRFSTRYGRTFRQLGAVLASTPVVTPPS